MSHTFNVPVETADTRRWREMKRRLFEKEEPSFFERQVEARRSVFEEAQASREGQTRPISEATPVSPRVRSPFAVTTPIGGSGTDDSFAASLAGRSLRTFPDTPPPVQADIDLSNVFLSLIHI